MRFFIGLAAAASEAISSSQLPPPARRVNTVAETARQSQVDTLEADASVISSARRRDIQALRALAVTAVFAFHAVPEILPGGFVGVDVFFVVSGYLVGGALVAEATSTGRVALLRFYARRVRRIAPLATMVAVVTIVGAFFTMSPIRLILWGSPADLATVTRDGIASVLGGANLWFGFSDMGYVMNDYVSPFTHYWSLGVEEQFYLVAPFAIALAVRRGRKFGALVIATASVLAFDFATAGIAPWGVGTFYNPVSRAWELGVGVLVAMAAPWLRAMAPRVGATAVVLWVSWLALAACAVAITTPDGWPTTTAIVPVAATAAILAGGVVRPAGRVASLTVLQWLGDRSYGIYLWHWPVVVLAMPYSPFSRTQTIAVAVVVTFGLSAASYRWIEIPSRRLPLVSRSDVRRILVKGIVVISGGLTVLAAIGVWATTTPTTSSMHASPYRLLHAGAAGQEFATKVPFNLRPELRNASSDRSVAYADGCNVKTRAVRALPTDCVYGTRGPMVALFGDSHALQWLEALLPAVERGEIRLALVTADTCPPFDNASRPYPDSCAEWQRLAIAHINSLKPQLVIASAALSGLKLEHRGKDGVAGLAATRLAADLAGVQVLWIADTPQFDQDPSICAAEDVFDITRCAKPRDVATSPLTRSPIQRAVVANGWHWLDLNDYMCSATECGIILGDVFMYRDNDHLSATFARELSPALMQAVSPLINEYRTCDLSKAHRARELPSARTRARGPSGSRRCRRIESTPMPHLRLKRCLQEERPWRSVLPYILRGMTHGCPYQGAQEGD